VAWDLVGRILIALVVGWVVGRVLGIVAFRPPGRLSALAETPQGFVAIAVTLLAYGATELLQGYGFLAVFVAAVVLRGTERKHEFHVDLHGFAEQIENLLVVGLLLLFGGALVSGIFDALTWQGAVIALLFVFVVRPLSGGIALLRSKLAPADRVAISFFGIRGFGSVYYLAYALSAAVFVGADELWAIVSLTMLVSIAVHGVTATPVMAMVDWEHGVARRRRGGRGAPEDRKAAGSVDPVALPDEAGEPH
jgi:NhaP-type Na+/H+ or K+/H+ antiporter